MGEISWVHPGRVAVLCGGQFGSEAKGNIAAWLANNDTAHMVNVATTSAGAQAGHTTCRANGGKYVAYHLPTCGIERPESHIFINAGAIIDVDMFLQELVDCKVNPERVTIHPRAAVITDAARASEQDPASAQTRSGSTQKGIGATLAAKVTRSGLLARDEPRLAPFIGQVSLNELLSRGFTVTMEVPQGLGLSLNHGLEAPFTTSRDCYVTSGLSDAGIHPHFLGKICMVVRSKPIRVGNIYDAGGGRIGYSGPFYPDSEELSWDKNFPWVQPERTTVTKRVRRIATWSPIQYANGLVMNRPSIVALSFCDYFRTLQEFHGHVHGMREIESTLGILPTTVFSVGPNLEDITADYQEVVAWLEKRGNV